MDSEKTPRKSRRRCIVLGAVVVLVVLIVALALGLFYGLKSPQPQKHVPLKVLSVRSDGLVGDTVRVAVVYQALPNHQIEWTYGKYDHTNPSAGKPTKMVQDGLEVFECSSDIPSECSSGIPSKSYINAYVYITSGIDSTYLRINGTTALSAWTYDIPEMESIYAYVNSSVEAPDSGNLTIYASLNIDPSDEYSSSADAMYLYLNTSADPPSVLETYSFRKDHITMSTNPSSSLPLSSSSNTTEVVFTLTQDITQFGGRFGINMEHKHFDQRYLEAFSHDVWIDVFRAGSNEVIPNGISGLSRKGMQAFFGDVFTVKCNAMGNPTPEVEILRQVDGKSYKMKSETTFRDRWSSAEIYTLHDKNTESGNYTCRAVSGTSTSTTVIEVYAAEEIQYVANETGVVERTADRIVVRCTATGVPTPILSFTKTYPDQCDKWAGYMPEWSGYSEDLIKSGLYKYYRNVTETSASLTMTITPVNNANIKLIYCNSAPPPGGYEFVTSTCIDLGQESNNSTPVSTSHGSD